ncbi:hypothetical protein BWI17_00385 [Betaproteobacteria bacterium GR16-43]|nr:hypothetical protein BWI17_00385 [Betaproteobacteria bacterium GR16-43]
MAQQHVVTVNPPSPKSYEAFTVTVTGPYAGNFAVNPDVSVNAISGEMVIDMRGTCGGPCTGFSTRSISINYPGPLPPRDYTLNVVLNANDPFFGQRASTQFTVTALPNYQGLWWKPSESGWGLQITHQGNTLFVAWFTYDDQGRPTWFVAPNVVKTGDTTYTGTLYRTTALPSQVQGETFQTVASSSITPAGNISLTFDGLSNATYTYNVDGVQQTKAITRQAFSTVPICYSSADIPSNNFTDLWWQYPAGSVPGWGLILSQQGGTMFMTIFGYDKDGRPSWLVASNMRITVANPLKFYGPLYRATGAPFRTSPWPSSSVSLTEVGMTEFIGPQPDVARFSLEMNFGRIEIPILREVFAGPLTRCGP